MKARYVFGPMFAIVAAVTAISYTATADRMIEDAAVDTIFALQTTIETRNGFSCTTDTDCETKAAAAQNMVQALIEGEASR